MGHRLARQVRFSVNPFLDAEAEGFNSYASKPAGEGLAIYLGLWVELDGEVDGNSGFVVNVSDIDRVVRESVVPLFAGEIKKQFREQKHISISALAGMLRGGWAALKGKFAGAKVGRLVLELNPFRKISVESEDCGMVYFGEKFEFSAMHKLWNEKFSDEENFRQFGKCANPAGHGHNYVVEVTVKAGTGEDFKISEFQRKVEEAFIRLVDHKNLNADVAEFAKVNPTVENIAAFAWNRLVGAFGKDVLSNVTVWETDRTYCSYSG